MRQPSMWPPTLTEASFSAGKLVSSQSTISKPFSYTSCMNCTSNQRGPFSPSPFSK